MDKIGVIGGLGPMATAYFMEMVISMTDAICDQEHINMVIQNNPSIPDRTSYILDNNCDNPLSLLLETGMSLMRDQVSVIAIPCITASYFLGELKKNISVPIIDIMEQTAIHLKEHSIKSVGLMATSGTIKTALFQQRLKKYGIDTVVPDEKYQEDVMHIIYKNVKAGIAVEEKRFRDVSEHLRLNGAEVILLGCTELSLIKKEFSIGPGYLDCMEVLAKTAVEHCGKLKSQYMSLITK